MTLVEVLVVIALIVVLIAILLVLLAPSSHNYDRRESPAAHQMRELQQGHILYAQGNNGWYAGLTSEGKLADAVSPERGKTYGADRKLGSLSTAILLTGNYFPPKDTISPQEPNPSIKPLSAPGMVTMANYSYAVSQAESAQADAGRIAEWRDKTNTLAPVITDRVLDGSAEANGAVALTRQRSIWTTQNGDWRGCAVFGDNSFEFLTTSTAKTTKYGESTNTNDNLFQTTGPSDAFQIRD